MLYVVETNFEECYWEHHTTKSVNMKIMGHRNSVAEKPE